MPPVLVLGAGFTKAFHDDSPLMEDDFGTAELLKDFENWPWARARVQDEVARVDPAGGKRINLERLMTRVHLGLPHDSDSDRQEGGVLFSRLKAALLARITRACPPTSDPEKLPHHLGNLASFIIKRGATVITFNYDEVLDAALVAQTPAGSGSLIWSPHMGYGFPFRDVRQIAATTLHGLEPPPMEVLKLHGSLGWRPVRGANKSALAIDSLVRVQSWEFGRFPPHAIEEAEKDFIVVSPLVEDLPFVVPPVMEKQLASESILSVIWARALTRLKSASAVTFVGFSMPITDFAARSLFYEGLRRPGGPPVPITVIDHPGAAGDDTLKTRYRLALGRGKDEIDFQFIGGLKWAEAQRPNA